MPRSPPAIGEARHRVDICRSFDIAHLREHMTGTKLPRRAERQEVDQISVRHLVTASDLWQTTYPMRQPQGRTTIVQQNLIRLVLD